MHIIYNSYSKKARKLSKPDDDRYRPKHVVSIANKHHRLAIYS